MGCVRKGVNVPDPRTPSTQYRVPNTHYPHSKLNIAMKAIWNDTVLAESSDTEVVEGNHYFPPESIDKDFFEASDRTSVCPWKGTASYFSIVVDGDRNENAAWTYPNPKDAASEIKDHVAFWNGVEVIGD